MPYGTTVRIPLHGESTESVHRLTVHYSIIPYHLSSSLKFPTGKSPIGMAHTIGNE